MIAFLLSPIGKLVILGAVAAAVGFGGAWKIQSGRIDTVKAEFSQFKGGVEALGKQAEAKAKQIEAENATKKVKADAENAATKRNLADVYAAYRKLRDSRSAGSGVVSTSPTFSPSADRTCFDSAKFVGAVGVLETGILKITERGDQAVVDLNTAKQWAQK